MATHLIPEYERLARFISSAEGDRAFPYEPYFNEVPLRNDELSTRREFVRDGIVIFPQTANIEFDDKVLTIPEVEEAAWKWELREKARAETVRAKSAMIKSVERLIRNLECKSTNKRVPCSSITGKHEWSYTKQKDALGEDVIAADAKCTICHVKYKHP